MSARHHHESRSSAGHRPGSAATTPRRRRGRPPAGEGVGDRDRLLDAALRAIRAKGPGTTMQDIAAEAAVTKPIVYRAFGDKDGVVDAVAEVLSLRIEATTRDATNSTTEPHAQFREATRAFLEQVRDDRQTFLFVEYGGGSQDGSQLRRMVDRASEPWLRSFGRSVDTGERADPAAVTWAYALNGALRTVALMWVHDPYCDLDELIDDLTRFAFRSERSIRP
ncbi:MAG: TetR/AcrR family transcriptional regulator [Actinomycetota bacterium]